MSGRGRTFSSKVALHMVPSLAGRFKNCLRAGKFSNSAEVWTMVPLADAAGVSTWSSVTEAHIFHPLEIISSLLTAAMDESASPLKPRVERWRRSVSEEILLVAWGRAQFSRSSRVMPHPLSTTLIFSIPPPVVSTDISVAPESTALSMSSRIMALGLSMTSPAAIFLATSALSCLTGFLWFSMSCSLP